MAILDGNAYDSRCMEGVLIGDSELEGCTLVLNNKETPLLAPGAGATHDDTHRVLLNLMVPRLTFLPLPSLLTWSVGSGDNRMVLHLTSVLSHLPAFCPRLLYCCLLCGAPPRGTMLHVPLYYIAG